MKATLTDTDQSIKLDVKRFHLPAVLSWDCPECGARNSHDFTSDYLSYPTANQAFAQVLWCRGCDSDEHRVTLRLNVSLELLAEP